MSVFLRILGVLLLVVLLPPAIRLLLNRLAKSKNPG